ncbi:MAG: 50S ribosomal protein L25 [Chitinophagales bacterium]
MKTISLEGEKRQAAGKKAAKLVRKENLVPCVMYGGAENVSFKVKYNDLLKIVFTNEFLKVNVNVDGKSVDALVKDIDFHPVTDKILHVDFQELVPGKIVKTEIPVKLTGRAVGVATGGVLELNLRKLAVKATPEQLVEFIELDVTPLELGKSIKVKDLKTELTVLTPGGNPIARVIVPRAMRSAATKAAGEEEGEAEEAAE